MFFLSACSYFDILWKLSSFYVLQQLRKAPPSNKIKTKSDKVQYIYRIQKAIVCYTLLLCLLALSCIYDAVIPMFHS